MAKKTRRGQLCPGCGDLLPKAVWGYRWCSVCSVNWPIDPKSPGWSDLTSEQQLVLEGKASVDTHGVIMVHLTEQERATLNSK